MARVPWRKVFGSARRYRGLRDGSLVLVRCRSVEQPRPMDSSPHCGLRGAPAGCRAHQSTRTGHDHRSGWARGGRLRVLLGGPNGVRRSHPEGAAPLSGARGLDDEVPRWTMDYLPEADEAPALNSSKESLAIGYRSMSSSKRPSLCGFLRRRGARRARCRPSLPPPPGRQMEHPLPGRRRSRQRPRTIVLFESR